MFFVLEKKNNVIVKLSPLKDCQNVFSIKKYKLSQRKKLHRLRILRFLSINIFAHTAKLCSLKARSYTRWEKVSFFYL